MARAAARRPSHPACYRGVCRPARRVCCACLGSMQSSVQLTTPAAVIQYLRAQPKVLLTAFDSKLSQGSAVDRRRVAQGHLEAEQVLVEELHAGKINHVFKLTAPGHETCLLKYAPPYVKSVGTSFALDQGRLRIEAQAMQLLQRHCPNHIPSVLFHDELNHVLLMQYLQPPHDKVLLGLHMQGLTYPQLPRQLAQLLACAAVHTSLPVLGSDAYQHNMAAFANHEVMAANAHVVLTDPMDNSCPDNYPATDPDLQSAIRAFRSDAVAQQALARLVDVYHTNKQALLHNDLHTGNLLATRTSMYCIDWEFASYGPVAFDLGSFMAVLALAYITLQPTGMPHGSEPASVSVETRLIQQAWLLTAIQELWDTFQTRCSALKGLHAANSNEGGVGSQRNRHRSASMQQSFDASVVLQDVFGYTAFAMFRLTAGMHSYPGYGWLPSQEEVRSRLQAVKVAHDLIQLSLSRDVSMKDLTAILCHVTAA